MLSNCDDEDFYGSPDCLLTPEDCRLHIANFSTLPVKIHKGQILGYSHDPEKWLNTFEELTSEEQVKLESYATLVRSLCYPVGSILDTLLEQMHKIPGGSTIPPGTEGKLLGGPKTAETAPDDISRINLVSEVHIFKDLSLDQRQRLEEILKCNESAFGLDGRLGHYPAKVEIPLREGAKETSCPPFFVSPVNRKVI
ncbi:hypothetical protein M422DRAFT_163758, partial [Sphaerobolus stellatus SS14]